MIGFFHCQIKIEICRLLVSHLQLYHGNANILIEEAIVFLL